MRHPRLILWTVAGISMLSTVGIALPYPILAPLFVDGPATAFNHYLGLPPKLLLGLAIALNPLGILIGSLVLGSFSDRYGRRQVMLWTLTLAILGYGLTAAALLAENYPLFALARFAVGLCEGNTAIARAIAADLHPDIDKNRSFATINSALYIGWLVGPLIGGLTAPLGTAVPFGLAGLLTLPCLILLAWLVPNTAPAKPDDGRSIWTVAREQHAFRLLADPHIRPVFWLQLAYTFGLTGFYEFFPLWLVEFARLDATGIAWVTAFQCLLMTFSSGFLWPRYGAHYPALPTARTMAAVVALGFLALALVTGHAGSAVIILLGVPTAIYGVCLPVYCSNRFDHHGQGAVMGLLSTIFCLSNVVVALIGSVLILIDTRLVMLGGALACAWAAWRLGALQRTMAAPTTA